MDIDKFIKDFVRIFDNEPSHLITDHTSFRDIDGWCSLSAMAFMAMMEEEYNIEIKGDDIKRSETIEDLFNLSKSKMK
jgi:Phosphopantetheine attachment site.